MSLFAHGWTLGDFVNKLSVVHKLAVFQKQEKNSCISLSSAQGIKKSTSPCDQNLQSSILKCELMSAGKSVSSISLQFIETIAFVSIHLLSRTVKAFVEMVW